MSTTVAFIIKDTEDGSVNPVGGIIAEIDKFEYSLEKLIEEVKDTFSHSSLLNKYGCSSDVEITCGLEAVNGTLLGCLYLTGYNSKDIKTLLLALLDNTYWSGTQATPEAVAQYIKDNDCSSSVTGPWKGIHNF